MHPGQFLGTQERLPWAGLFRPRRGDEVGVFATT